MDSSEREDVIVLPMQPQSVEAVTTDFVPEQFFGAGRLEELNQRLEAMRDEWGR